MQHRLGIDVGGTFTDLMARDPVGGLSVWKVLSIPVASILDGLGRSPAGAIGNIWLGTALAACSFDRVPLPPDRPRPRHRCTLMQGF